MCGFLGQVLPPTEAIQAQQPLLRASAKRIAHRGNSSQGDWTNKNAAFYHYRLAFRDLSQGQQPMLSADQSAVLVYNGELYDFRKLKNIAYPFQTSSDTEVILAQLLNHGPAALRHFDGEFAIGFFQPNTQRLLLARDPFGVKPLFFQIPELSPSEAQKLLEYSPKYELKFSGSISFASEMKALPNPLRWHKRGLERQILGLYEEMGTAWENVFALAPGSFAQIEWQGDHWRLRIERFSIPARHNSQPKKNWDFRRASGELRQILKNNVSNKLDSDVPLGVYLSGGIDSRAVAAEMRHLKTSLPSFTVGFSHADYDETAAVKEFTRKFPYFRPHFLRTNDTALQYAYPIALYHSEIIQPYTNGAAKWWLSRFTRRYVRGVLTGDGADEVFCGYPSYRYLAWWQFLQRHPNSSWRKNAFAKKFSAAASKPWENGWSAPLDGLDLSASKEIFGWPYPLAAQANGIGNNFLAADLPAWLEEEAKKMRGYAESGNATSPLAMWQNYFLRTHFPTHVLNWVGDRMEMANTLEGRPLFLSQSIQKLLAELPDVALVRGFNDKAILRAAYADELADFAYAPKKQFNAPFLYSSEWEKTYLHPQQWEKLDCFEPGLWQNLQSKIQALPPGLEKSFLLMLRQNLIVVLMQQYFLVEKNSPDRDIAWEESFLDTNSELPN